MSIQIAPLLQVSDVMNHPMGRWLSGGPQRCAATCDPAARAYPPCDGSSHVRTKCGEVPNIQESQHDTHLRLRRQIQRLLPVSFVQERLVTDRSMVGLHVRNVFDVPRDIVTNVNVTGTSAVAGAEKEYGKEISDTLLQWRKASHWRNFCATHLDDASRVPAVCATQQFGTQAEILPGCRH